MKFLRLNRSNPKTLLGLFMSGSLVVLLICLSGAAFVFSATFLKKEEQRSLISTDQLTHSFEFQYRLMTEEMWTQNYEAIAYRIEGIAKQFGRAQYDLVLADAKGKCVFASAAADSASCVVPDPLRNEITQSRAQSGGVKAGVRYDTSTERYVYSVPLFVGAVLKGYLYATISDPYGFFRGNLFLLTLRMFLPAIACVLLVWIAWLLLSRRFILRPYLSSLVELEKKEALGKLAAQVAHDIQSPLAVLTSVVLNAKGLSRDQNLLLKSASSRIHSLADDLLARYKDPNSKNELQFTLVSATVSSILSEKNGMLGDRSTVELKSEIEPDALAIGVPLSSSNLLRIMSNLLNNAIEATKDRPNGRISVRVTKNVANVVIAIEDTGEGISPEILHKIRTVGGTYGKANGAGIGLQFTRETVISVGGRFSIDSQLGKGTVVTLEIPTAATPEWCATHLEIDPTDKILVLDDDESVHLLWKQRLAGRDVTYIKDPEDFDPRLFPISEYRFIFDHEISGSAVTGLDLITSHRLGERAVLVTSYFNDPQIQQSVARAKARILPKFIMSCVEIAPSAPEFELERNAEPDLVLLDDEAGNHTLWRVQAKRAGKRLLSVKTECELDRYAISQNVPIFVDHRLGDGVTGYEVAERLHAKGYRNLFLTTGDKADTLPTVPYIREIIGKGFPASFV